MSHYNPPTYTSSRPPPSHIRSASSSTNASPALLQRINEKKAELASLKELQTLSKALADQMEQLEEKLGTLSDGTEAVAAVLSNWHNVLRAISMASCKFVFSLLSSWSGVSSCEEEIGKGDEDESRGTEGRRHRR